MPRPVKGSAKHSRKNRRKARRYAHRDREYNTEWEVQCKHKVKYSALTIDRHVIGVSLNAGIPIYKYNCKFCGAWHLTKSRQGDITDGYNPLQQQPQTPHT